MYKQGQNVICRVNFAEKNGYSVTILKDNLPGFIRTVNALKAGDEIVGVFVCVHQGRILLSQLFSAPRVTSHQLAQTKVNGEEHLDSGDLDRAYEQEAMTSRHQRLSIAPPTDLSAEPETNSDGIGSDNVIRLDFKKRRAKKNSDKPE